MWRFGVHSEVGKLREVIEVSQIRAVSLRPGAKEGDFHVTVEPDFL